MFTIFDIIWQVSHPAINKYQLSLTTCDGIMLQTEPDDQCDKLTIDCRNSEVLST